MINTVQNELLSASIERQFNAAALNGVVESEVFAKELHLPQTR